MNPLLFIVVYIIIWWLVLFMVLPVGVKPEQNPEGGNMKGAPQNPNIKIKLIATTLITFVITSGYFYAVEKGWIVISPY